MSAEELGQEPIRVLTFGGVLPSSSWSLCSFAMGSSLPTLPVAENATRIPHAVQGLPTACPDLSNESSRRKPPLTRMQHAENPRSPFSLRLIGYGMPREDESVLRARSQGQADTGDAVSMVVEA